LNIYLALDKLGQECAYALDKVKYTKWLRLRYKFKAQSLEDVNVDIAIVESPEEAHKVGDNV